TRMRGRGSLMRAPARGSPAEESTATARARVLGLLDLLPLGDLGPDLLSVLLGALALPLAADPGPGSLLDRRGETTELPAAAQLVPELFLDELHHDRVVEKAERRDLVRDQILGVGEVRESGEHLVLHRLRRLVLLVEDDLRHVLERLDRVEHEARRVSGLAHG